MGEVPEGFRVYPGELQADRSSGVSGPRNDLTEELVKVIDIHTHFSGSEISHKLTYYPRLIRSQLLQYDLIRR
ncbi:hypothetical protein ES703_78891 [subsurface metagenome]